MARRKKQKLDLDQEQVPISQQIKRFFDIDCFVEFMLPQEMVEEVYAVCSLDTFCALPEGMLNGVRFFTET